MLVGYLILRPSFYPKKRIIKKDQLMVTEKTSITIHSWMRNELQLKGNDLIIYALVYGYSQGDNGKYHGSQNYMSEWLGISKSAINERLKNLVKEGLLIKENTVLNNIKFCSYKHNPNKILPRPESGHPDRNQVTQTGIMTIDNQCDKILPRPESGHNTNTIDILNIEYFPKNKEVDSAFKEYLKIRLKSKFILTDRAISALISKLRKYSEDDSKKAIEIIDNAIISKWKSFYPLKN